MGNESWQTRSANDPHARSGLAEILEEISPIEDFSGTMSLSFSAPRFDEVKASIEECKDRQGTGEIRFVKVCIVDGEGRPIDTALCGQDIGIVVSYQTVVGIQTVVGTTLGRVTPWGARDEDGTDEHTR